MFILSHLFSTKMKKCQRLNLGISLIKNVIQQQLWLAIWPFFISVYRTWRGGGKKNPAKKTCTKKGKILKHSNVQKIAMWSLWKCIKKEISERKWRQARIWMLHEWRLRIFGLGKEGGYHASEMGADYVNQTHWGDCAPCLSPQNTNWRRCLD